MNLSSKSCKELINICKEIHIKGYSGKKKVDIIQMIHKKYNSQVRSPRNDTDTIISVYTSVNKSEHIAQLLKHLNTSIINHENEIMLCNTLKDAHSYCIINNISGQQYGPLLEKYIRVKFNYIKNKAENCIGDCSKDGNNSEIKVSLGGAKHTKFNFVQIRPLHDCNTYIFTAYHLSYDNVNMGGDLYVFKIPKINMIEIIISYGGYAHGTIREHGNITIETINDDKSIKEYAIRPLINDKCWQTLLTYRVNESEL
jgi:hypothetical protein